MPEPTFQNISRADLYRCNLDPSGRYTAYWGSSARRDNYFTFSGGRISPVAPYCMPIDDSDKFCYIRKDGILKVDVNADILDSYGINYCRFRNDAFKDDFYIYAFVDSIEYIAPHTSALHIRVDTFTTYQDYIERNEQYIMRRTVDYAEDAAIKYGYSLPEQINGSNYKSDKVSSCVFNTSTDFFGTFQLGILAKPFPLNNSDGWINVESADPNYTLKGVLNGWCAHHLNGYPTGCNIFIAHGTADLSVVSDVVNALGSEIVGTFWIQNSEHDNITYKDKEITFYIQDVTSKVTKSGFSVHTIATMGVKNLELTEHIEHYGKSDTLDHYEPINGKCFTYPYNYIVASDNNGTIINYRFEDFPEGNVGFECKFIASTDNAIVLRPLNFYMGNNDTLDYSLFITGFPQCPYMSDNYAMYLGTHAAQTAVARYARYMDYGKSLISIGVAGYKMGNAFESRMYTTPSAAAEHKKEKEKALVGLGESFAGLGKALNNSMRAIAEQADEYAVNVYNAGATSNMATLGYLGVVIYHKYLCKHDMQRVDEYFSRYGYAWMKLENLNFTKCPDYNYIQTQGCNIEGAIPVSAKQELSALFDSGITIWDCSTDGKIERFGKYADATHKNKGNP